MSEMCPACNKKIGVLSKIGSIVCSLCNKECHYNCTDNALDSDSFNEGIVKRKFICKKCLVTYIKEFGDASVCDHCRNDIITSVANGPDRGDETLSEILKEVATFYKENLIKCELCKNIGHITCYSLNANKISFFYLRNLYNRDKAHVSLCNKCTSSLEHAIEEIANREEPIIVKGKYIKGYNIVKEIKSISTDSYPNEATARAATALQGKQINANGIINYWYDKHPVTVLRGYSENNNPYYGTDMYYSAKGMAVKIEKNPKPQKAI